MSTGKSIGIFALPLTIDGVGADQVLPADAHLNGVTLRIPPWPAPSIIPGRSDQLEIWILEPGASGETRFYDNLFPVPVVFPDAIHLSAQYLQQIGDITLRYRVTAGDHGNPDDAIPQVFILKRPIPVNLKEPLFPNATLHGYLLCSTSPKIWEEVNVRVPAQPGIFLANDVCALEWEGFTSPNGVTPIPGTALRIEKILSQEDVTSPSGFDFKIESKHYITHIKPIEYGSATCTYTHYRNGVPLGSSEEGLVRIDRRVAGGLTCDR